MKLELLERVIWRSLGLVWAECGHEVFFGARRKAKAAAELSHHSTRYGTASWKRILSQSNEEITKL